MKKQLNPTLVYILTVLGLLCCCFAGFGFLLSGPAYLIANNKIKQAQLNPEGYEGDIKSMETARLIALVVLIINILYLIFTIYQINLIGWDNMIEQSRQMVEEYQLH